MASKRHIGSKKRKPGQQRYKSEGRLRKNKIARALKYANKFGCSVIISTPLYGIEKIQPQTI